MFDFKQSWIAAAAVLVLLGAGIWYVSAQPKSDEQVFCTADAMQCPDGSYVGRSGPHCEFVCPAATSTSGGGTTGGGTGGGGGILPYNSGIRGVVMAGPTCPVERDPPDPACADKPVETNITVVRAVDPTRVVVVTTSNKQGMFEAPLPPGEYVIQAGPYGVPYPRCSDTRVSVQPNTYARVAVSCDTGIR
ncbi:hypothetical protein EXS62_00335 [Candidatus Kaiserbacteria bacterium]|nr:hypothetical protein [Candidatus Kaiserbacteria bacterium]